jgi:hypothetical protein
MWPAHLVVSPLASKVAISSGMFRNKSEQCGQPTQVVGPLASKMAFSSGLFRNKSEQCGQPAHVGRPLAAWGSPVSPGRSTVNKSATVTCTHSQRSVDPFRYLPVSGDSTVFIQLIKQSMCLLAEKDQHKLEFGHVFYLVKYAWSVTLCMRWSHFLTISCIDLLSILRCTEEKETA